MKKFSIIVVAVVLFAFGGCAGGTGNPSDSIWELPGEEAAQSSSQEEFPSSQGEPALEEAESSEEPEEPEASAPEVEPDPPAAVTMVALEIESAGGVTGRREYVKPGQLEGFLAFAPRPQDTIPVGEDPAGGKNVVMKVYRGNLAEKYWFAPHRVLDDGGQWYAIANGVFDLMCAMTQGYEPGALSSREEAVLFRGEAVTALYSLDGANYSYHNIDSTADAALIAAGLEDLDPADYTKGSWGFLVVTDSGRYDYFLEGDVGGLRQHVDAYNQDYNRHAQWLCFLAAENIQSIRFQGALGPGMSLRHTDVLTNVSVETADPDSIGTIVRVLKKMIVAPKPEVSSGQIHPNLPMDVYQMQIVSKTGVSYQIFGASSGISIYADDLDRTVGYGTTETEIRALRELMSLLPEAKLDRR